MKTILLTGAAGFIGSHVCDALLARGDRVAGLDSFNDYYNPALKRANLAKAQTNERFRLYEADICHAAQLEDIVGEVRPDVVVHLAARAGVRPSLLDPHLYHTVNIGGTQNLLDAIRKHPVSHAVLASTSAVYGGSTQIHFRETDPVFQPISIYAATKRMNEMQASIYSSLYGLHVTMLRFFTVYGPRQRPDMAIHLFTEKLLAGAAIPMFGDGETRRDYTYVDDIVSGVLQAVDRPFRYEIFNLGESHTTTLRELIALLGEALGVSPRIEQLPAQPGDVPLTYADVSHARELLGYAPTTDMRTGLARFAEWHRQRAQGMGH